eukprot:GHVH01010857.1.p1 GENE.GHVH01010857.1~~GHVH01010857.1.p1  ORF type:complete len:496 (+),score=61.46 GHVH01010857.1:34-1521(+)
MTCEPAVFSVEVQHDLVELKSQLQNALRTSDVTTRRDSLRKVLLAMNQSLDVSQVFAEMVQASDTSDVVQKRMILQYLTANAALNPSLSILAVNTLLKDCGAQNPHIRSMGLSSLVCLSSLDILEYVQDPIQSALRDKDPTVRANGVDTCLKVFELVEKDSAIADELVSGVTAALGDENVIVFIRAVIATLSMAPELVIAIQSIVIRILNSMQDHQIDPVILPMMLLNIVQPYRVSSSEEYYDILNILDAQLDSINLHLVCCVIKTFVAIIKSHQDEDHHAQLYSLLERCTDILITHSVCCDAPEMSTVALNTLLMLLKEVDDPKACWALIEPEIQYIIPQIDESQFLHDIKFKIFSELNCPQSKSILTEIVTGLIDPVINSSDQKGTAVDTSIQLIKTLYDPSQSMIAVPLFALKSLTKCHLGVLERRALPGLTQLLCSIDEAGQLAPILSADPELCHELERAFHYIAEYCDDVRCLKYDIFFLIRDILNLITL